MSNTSILLNRNRQFASDFSSENLPPMPILRTIILACVDARVDPAHILGLELGEVGVIRNNGGRVTQAVIDEIGALAFMSAMADGSEPRPFDLVLMQHTQCGAERFADPGFQNALKAKTGLDVAHVAISDHEQSLQEDVERLRTAPEVPGYIVVSGYIYDVQHGNVREVIAPAALAL
ncbi:hypothetical protein A9Q94_08420 [Rhodobacterales bacterium 56_14_T64]|nr:hypothetical protein A9Q94_08420 [Rhodobacterales bacterium 56_14_T64]